MDEKKGRRITHNSVNTKKKIVCVYAVNRLISIRAGETHVSDHRALLCYDSMNKENQKEIVFFFFFF